MSALTMQMPRPSSLIELLNPFIRLFDGAANPAARSSWKAMVQSTRGKAPGPAFALTESDGAYVVNAFLPGATSAGALATVEGDELRVRARCETRYTDGNAFSYVRQKQVDERFTLPADALHEGLRTDFVDGVLYVAIPRRMALSAPLQNTG